MYFAFCISTTFVKSISQSILKYFLQLYFVFKYYLNVFYPALVVAPQSL